MRLLILAAALAAASCPVSATSLSSTVTLASDYLFDGISQTQGDSDSRYRGPALQASLDLTWESGFYLGTWASNVDYGSSLDEDTGLQVRDPANIEIDLYAGYAWESANGFGYDIGLAHYTYTGAPTEGYDYTEAYFGLTFPVGTGLKLFVADDEDVLGGFSWRAKGTHSFALGETYSLDLEVTRTEPDAGGGYWHGQVGVSRAAGPFEMYFGYSDTDIRDNPAAQGRFLFTIATTVEFF
jgi:uncharacterized protein (TIGR02001 family)